MKISKNSKQPLSQQVNRVGEYLYKNIDGAFRIVKGSNKCDVYMILLYQLYPKDQRPEKGPEYNDVHQMTINLSVTYYDDKIRVNVIECTQYEKTLGHFTVSPELLADLSAVKTSVLAKVQHYLVKAYQDYNFLF